MKGQLSAEMLILIVVIIAIVAIAANQLINQSKNAAEQINKTSSSILEQSKTCTDSSNCTCPTGKTATCDYGVCGCK